jgi:hypothetical protein
MFNTPKGSRNGYRYSSPYKVSTSAIDNTCRQVILQYVYNIYF